MDRESKTQIQGSGGSESQFDEVINQQNAITGESREVNVESYAGVAKLVEVLKDVSFPAPKSKILRYVVQSEILGIKIK